MEMYRHNFIKGSLESALINDREEWTDWFVVIDS